MQKKVTRVSRPERADPSRLRVSAEIEAVAQKEGFADFEEKVLSIPAFSMHPSWGHAGHDVLIGDDGSVIRLGATTEGWFSKPANLTASRVNGVIFITEDAKPFTVKQTVDWLKKTHPEVVATILRKYEEDGGTGRPKIFLIEDDDQKD